MKILAPLTAVEKKDFTYEMKFLLPASSIEPALAWARTHLVIDPHIHDAKSDCYRVTSLYFDTQTLDTYRRTGSYARTKYRVRRYASEESVFLERKMKTRGIVGKRRVRVPDGEITKLLEPNVDPNWVGCWFHRRLALRDLRPRSQITYERVARVGTSSGGTIRMTLDRNARCWAVDQLGFVSLDGGTDLLNGSAILELKYQISLPAPFKELADRLGVRAAAVSKYRMSIAAMGLAPQINGKEHPASADPHEVPISIAEVPGTFNLSAMDYSWLEKTLDTTNKITPYEVVARLVVAFGCGYLVSAVYRFTRPKEDVSASFIPTLVLITILIALVSQVIGDSAAKAFTLVGTLSIVRFRTVVRDAQDTAYVIFAVVIGMAVGTSHAVTAILGIVVVGIAAFIVQPRRKPAVWEWADTLLTVKIGSTQHAETLLTPVLKKYLDHFDVSSVATARQGIALELNYKVRLKEKVAEADLVKELNTLDGVQSVDLRRIELEG